MPSLHLLALVKRTVKLGEKKAQRIQHDFLKENGPGSLYADQKINTLLKKLDNEIHNKHEWSHYGPHSEKLVCATRKVRLCLFHWESGLVFFFFRQILQFCFVLNYEEESCLLRLLTSVLCRFFFPFYFQGRHLHLLGESRRNEPPFCL